ncbi:MAG: hypothetical protein P8189_00745 [Anaerolineae bacterium]|jgi:hypothetical protein
MQQLPILQMGLLVLPAWPDLLTPDVPSGLRERLVSRPIERLTVGLPRPSDDLSRETCRFLRLGHAARQIEGGRL